MKAEIAIAVAEFSGKVTAKTNLPTEMITEIVGGLSNLYLEKAIENDGLLEMTTELGLVSTLFPSSVLIREIQNCSGMDEKSAKETLGAIEETVREIFEERQTFVEGSAICFGPLGTITVLDSRMPSYRISYEDPARPDYSRFLLKHK